MASENAQPRKIRSGTAPGRPGSGITGHPLAVALSAPMRFVAERIRGRGDRPDPDAGPEPYGDRFPRRPKPTPPDDSVALSEPRG